MNKYFFLVCCMLFPNIIFSQGVFLDHGQSGKFFGAGYSSSNNANGISLGVGYSIAGRFDFGVNYLISKDSNDLQSSHRTFSPFIEAHIIKQNESFPISLSTNLSYNIGTTSSTWLREMDLKSSNTGFIISGDISHKLKINKTLQIVPTVGISGYIITTKLEDDFDNTTQEQVLGNFFRIKLPIIYNTKSLNKFVLSPEISLDENISTFSIALTFVIQNKK